MSYLAPERSGPSSVISEYYFNSLHDFPTIANEKERCVFGEEYEREFCFYLAKNAEINIDDRVCLIGEEVKWAKRIEERLFLNKTVYFIDCNLQTKMIEQRLSTNQFDQIILLNCLHQIHCLSMTPIQLLRRSLAKNGRLTIVYREPSENTLPIPQTLLTKWLYKFENSTQCLKALYREKNSQIEIFEKIETIQFRIHKVTWFSLLYYRMFYPLTLIQQKQMMNEMRQLNETCFKYHSGLVELHDRLTFLAVQKTDDLSSYLQSSKRLCQSQISITDEMTQLLNLRKLNSY